MSDHEKRNKAFQERQHPLVDQGIDNFYWDHSLETATSKYRPIIWPKYWAHGHVYIGQIEKYRGVAQLQFATIP